VNINVIEKNENENMLCWNCARYIHYISCSVHTFVWLSRYFII